uniref:ARAD1D36212p n=1 Tax=Blastobotrys adeninivorans TaxID=409370 RepID=A0A060TI52_BLAAD
MPFSLIARGNDALNINPPTGADIHLTVHGSDWYWAAFSVFALSFLLFLGASYKLRPANERLFFYNSIASALFMTVTYFTLASNLGWAPVQAEFNHQTVDNSSTTPGMRQVSYARYIGWFLAFPPLIANLAVISSVPWPTTWFTILAQEVMIVGLLVGIVIHSTYKWGFFVFAVVGYFVVAFNLLFSFRKTATYLDGRLFNGVQMASGAVCFLLLLYPICWGLSEGGNAIAVDSEAVFYGILDLLMFVVVNCFFQVVVRNADFTTLGISRPTGGAFHEKHHSFETPRPAEAPPAPAPAPAPVSAPEPTNQAEADAAAAQQV